MWNDNITYDIESEDGVRLTCVTLSTLEKMIEKVKKDFGDQNTSDTILLPFEFIIGSLFPESYNQMKALITNQYIEGYNAGFEEGSREEDWEELK